MLFDHGTCHQQGKGKAEDEKPDRYIMQVSRLLKKQAAGAPFRARFTWGNRHHESNEEGDEFQLEQEASVVHLDGLVAVDGLVVHREYPKES